MKFHMGQFKSLHTQEPFYENQVYIKKLLKVYCISLFFYIKGPNKFNFNKKKCGNICVRKSKR